MQMVNMQIFIIALRRVDFTVEIAVGFSTVFMTKFNVWSHAKNEPLEKEELSVSVVGHVIRYLQKAGCEY